MKSNKHRILLGIILLGCCIIPVAVRAQCPVGDSTQSGNNGSLYQWGGTTASFVTVTQITTALNNFNDPVVVSQTNPTATPFQITIDSCSLTEQTFQRWLKNGGYTSDGSNVGDYVATVQLTFSNAVPANEVFIALTDMDARGVANVTPDGFIRFSLPSTASNATPANFQMVFLTTAGNPAMSQVTSYNADGSGGIDFGITATDTGANRYLALLSSDTVTVKAINIFMRNIGDDAGIYVGAISPNTMLSLGVTGFKGKNIHHQNILNWSMVHDANTSYFVIEKNQNGSNETFVPIGNVPASHQQAYQFIDEKGLAEKNFYRLKIADKNGSFSYSPIIAIINNGENNAPQITPNPASGNSFSITNATGIEDVKLLDYTGRMVQNVRFDLIDSGCNVNVQNAALPKGLYIVRYKYAGNITANAKLLIQ